VGQQLNISRQLSPSPSPSHPPLRDIMSIQVTGKIEKRDIGTGVWVLVAEDGTLYELQKIPKDLPKPCDHLTLIGEPKPDVMTLAAIGTVLEVQSFHHP